MSTKLLLPACLAIALGCSANADAPSVAVDIAPVHSFVARVMVGVGQPDLVIPPGATPHEYNLKPSEARALQDAEIVFWLGEDLTPWLANAIETLSGGASVTALMGTEGTVLLAFRENALFEAQDDHDGHGHDDHDDHGHGHGEHDAHAWLSPDNAATWLNVIAAVLAAADPENADTYRANAAAGREEIAALKSHISGILDPVRGKRFIAFHDAYQYFETAFDFPASGAISISDASDPSPARIAEIQGRVRKESIGCVLTEPQFNPGMVATVIEGTKAKTGVLDPIGSALRPGPDMYSKLLKDLATTLVDCLR